jgi:Fe-S-cluster-containing dehydrogenase component
MSETAALDPEVEGSAPPEPAADRRAFLRELMKLPCTAALVAWAGPFGESAEGAEPATATWEAAEHYYGMGIQVERCIGCGRCVAACKSENDVLKEPYYFRTWIERYDIHSDTKATVDSPEGGIKGFPPREEDRDVMRSFFVPKLCNQCDNPPCVQVCPVGATFKTPDGVVLVDQQYCIGCRYCIQACPYGARYLDPRTNTADKCTFCYHRITKGMLPACVEVCPTQARVFGDLRSPASPLRRMMRTRNLQVLKPALNTEPKVYYSTLDKEVR